MLHVTVGHPRTAAMLDLEESARRAGLDFRPLRPEGERERIHFIDKYLTLAHALHQPSVRPHDIVLFTDAYDTLVTGAAAEIRRAFAAGDSDIVFNGEPVFWPPADGPDDPVQAYFDDHGTERCRYLNSGCYIGYAGAIRTMLSHCLTLSRETGDQDDQRLAARFTAQAAARHQLRVTVDAGSTIFGTLGGSLELYDYAGGAVRNRATGTWPPILHANGDKGPVAALSVLNMIHRLVPEGLDLLAIRAPGGLLHDGPDDAAPTVRAQPGPGLCVAVRAGPSSAFLLSPDRASIRSFRPDGALSTAPWAKGWETLALRPDGIRTSHDTPLTAYGLGTAEDTLTACPLPLAALAHWTPDQVRATLAALASL
ncbi:hypothetical protein AA13595_1342 [Gluconacetobacter johannae DSM 13595]|uniref:PLOD1-3-like GT domain-containing protein n=1 Tax=Gluconacetobacter johannae TaxID=112140 RepID=A0A7W4JA04_9PROT|nr:glycosyltransferase domain-containing protein [Gluconacetobacter johannae]MBB2177274.1 hypothetical protein [Gluconacetobacter johannae]GBQ84187.1 hypothetical protein AA13595_1342 [Gluconacetobacter johannae DSM 13595]